MKRCPQCRRDYYDDRLLYCLDDGTELLEGPVGIHSTAAPTADQKTVMLHSTEPTDVEPATRVFDRNLSVPKDNSNAVAVLPFADLSQNEDNEYFSDGLAEELLNVLSKIKGIRVAARTSAFAFKGKQASIEEIGKALHVQSVLEGSVRVAGSRVRIAVQLVDVDNGYNLWSETYDRTMDDIFAIQDDIAHSVVEEVRERFVGAKTDPSSREKVADEVAEAIKGRATDSEAHRLMLLGRYLLERANENDTIRAAEYFRQALEIDPHYALCWAQLGRAFFLASGYGWRALDIDYRKAEEALRKALDLDPNLAEALAQLGRVRSARDGDFVGADQCLKRALALAPENINVLLNAASLARELGQFEKAIGHYRRAAAIDPLSPGTWAAELYACFLAEDLSGAEFAARQTLELSPQRIFTHACLGLVLLMQGRPDEALAEALLEPANGPWRSWSLTIIYNATGRSDESDAELDKLVAEFGIDSAFQIAEAHSMRSQIDEAFTWLERSVDQRDPGRTVTRVSPLLKPLHDDSRWNPMLKKIGFSEKVSEAN